MQGAGSKGDGAGRKDITVTDKVLPRVRYARTGIMGYLGVDISPKPQANEESTAECGA
jgi:hypothetical protein